MPTYEYECLKCGHPFEEFREITAPPRERCPRCRGRVRRVISGGAGIVFKGSGWYATDGRQSGRRPAAGPEEGATAAPPAETTPPPAAEPAKPAAPSDGKPAKAGKAPRDSS